MISLSQSISLFIKGINRNKISVAGAVIVTVSFPLLLICAILDFMEIIHTPVFGAFVYMFLTPVFLVGHIILFFGFFFARTDPDKTNIFTYAYFKKHIKNISDRTSFRNISLFATFLGVINFMILALVSYTGHHYSERAEFCGTLCHTVMSPEYIVYKNSPHSNIACVNCHVGPGIKWFLMSKISGLRQVAAIATDSYSHPIEVPIHGLRPARETCEECHRPELFHGDKLYVKDKYEEDEENSHLQTVLWMKVGSGGQNGDQGIHWHVASENKIMYTYEDRARQIISKVKLIKPDGSEVVYRNPDAAADSTLEADGHNKGTKEMDCVDCHNRPTHIYLSAAEAVDKKINTGLISTELPFIKREAMSLLTAGYTSQDEAAQAIAKALPAWYEQEYPDLVKEKKYFISQAVTSIQQAYRENVFPTMNIDWDTYISNIGHKDDGGCFRCHNDSFESEDGATISQDCENCHILLAEEEADPEIIKSLKGE